LLQRPSISDQIKVGFYSSDRASQTDQTDILVLKNATEQLQFLSKVSRTYFSFM